MPGLLDFDPTQVDWNDAAASGAPDYSGLLDSLKAQPVQAAPVKQLIDANPAGFAPTPSVQAPKGPSLWSRLKTKATTPNDKGFTLGDILFATGSVAAGQPELAVNYRNAVTKRNQDQQAEGRRKALGALLAKARGPDGRLNQAIWTKGLQELGGDVDVGDVAAIEKEYRPHRQAFQNEHGITIGDPEDEASWKQVVKYGGKPVKIGDGWAIPDDGGETPAAPGASEAGGDTLPDVVPPAAAGSARGVRVAGGPTQASYTPNGQAAGRRGPVAYTPQDLDALTRALATEALGEGPQGMAAVGNVILNRVQSGYGGAKSIGEVVNAPHQFEGMSRAGQVTPEAYAQAQQVARQLLAGGADPTGGATQFLNPELQAQLGRAQPSWATGDGQRIGRHVFYGGQGDGQQQAQAAPGADASATMAGGAGGDEIEAPPPGYRWLVPPKSKNVWRDVPKTESEAWGPGAYQRNGETGEIKQVAGSGKGGAGKLSPAQQKDQDASFYSLGVASGINTRFDKSIAALDTGLLKPSLVGNAAASLYNKTGISTPQSRALASFKSNLLRTVNESLRLNKGVQTEGDAKRAADEIMQNFNDPDLVRQRLLELKDMNSQAVELHKAMVNQIREDAGMAPADFSKFEAKALPEREKTAQGGAKSPPERGLVRPAVSPGASRVIRYDAQGRRVP